MYIVRIGQGGELRESAPCHHCHEKMLFFGIKTLIYSKEVRPISIDGKHNVVANQTDKNIMFVKCPTASFTPTVVTTDKSGLRKVLNIKKMKLINAIILLIYSECYIDNNVFLFRIKF